MKKYAIIVAGGTGSRMGKEIPKQFIELNGIPVLLRTVNRFIEAIPDIELIIVMHAGYIAAAENLLTATPAGRNLRLVPGASTRSGSVKAGLQCIHDEDSMVLVHDAVRCLLSAELIRRCCEAALGAGNAIPAVTAVDSVRLVYGSENKAVDRNTVWMVQTPQVFNTSELKKAYSAAGEGDYTDDASVLEMAGHKINIVEGERTNIKITHPLDLFIASKILENQ